MYIENGMSMNRIIKSSEKVTAYYETDNTILIKGNCFDILEKLEPESVDMIFADPPYFLSNNGITCKGG